MRKLLLLALLAICTPAWADPSLYCTACRDVYGYPMDFGNYAYNEVLGASPSLPMADGGRLIVVNPAGQWAVVDMSFILDPIGISLSLLVVSWSVHLPDGRVSIRVQDPRGDTTDYYVFSGTPDLLVGDGSAGTTQPEPEAEIPAINKPGGGGSASDFDYIWYPNYMGMVLGTEWEAAQRSE